MLCPQVGKGDEEKGRNGKEERERKKKVKEKKRWNTPRPGNSRGLDKADKLTWERGARKAVFKRKRKRSRNKRQTGIGSF